MAFLGIDQSLNATGLCRVAPDGTVEAVATITPSDLVDGPRLAFIKRGVASMLSGISQAAMEGYSYDSVGRVFELGEVGGVIKVLLVESCVPYVVVPPALVKKFATGFAAAKKEDMLDAARKRGFETDDDNQADAFFLAHIARARAMNNARHRCEMEVLRTLRQPPEDRKPKRRVRRLVKAAI